MTRPLPPGLGKGPFTRREALAAGCSERMLRGSRFTQIHPRVWALTGHVLTDLERIRAARLAMPDRAHLTGASRIRLLGLDVGGVDPVRFVVAGDLHLALEGIMLHRTEVLPPLDDDGVTPAAAFIAFCASATVVDAIAVGDWLLHQEHMTLLGLRELAHRDRWRAGAREAQWVSAHLDDRSLSLPESRTRAALVFAGLPVPGVNTLVRDGDRVVIADLDYLTWNLVIEYEGRHHQMERHQYLRDIDRYAMYRRLRIEYLQVTAESTPVALVGEVYRALLRGGYDGPAPVFGDRWQSLRSPLSAVVRKRGVTYGRSGDANRR